MSKRFNKLRRFRGLSTRSANRLNTVTSELTSCGTGIRTISQRPPSPGNPIVTCRQNDLSETCLFNRSAVAGRSAKIMANIGTTSVPAEAPWHAAYPPPRNTPASLSREELLEWLQNGKTPGQDFILVDLRRTDFEVSELFLRIAAFPCIVVLKSRVVLTLNI